MAALLPRVRAGAAQPSWRGVGEVVSLLSQPPASLRAQLLPPPGPAARRRVLLELAATSITKRWPAPAPGSFRFWKILRVVGAALSALAQIFG